MSAANLIKIKTDINRSTPLFSIRGEVLNTGKQMEVLILTRLCQQQEIKLMQPHGFFFEQTQSSYNLVEVSVTYSPICNCVLLLGCYEHAGL